MLRSIYAGVPGRPNRQLLVKVSFDDDTRKVVFPSTQMCKLKTLRKKVEEIFLLSQCPFHLKYTDDDGEDFPIKTEEDLAEAISYFASGDDDYSIRGSDGSGARLAMQSQKVTMKVYIVVEYNASLSDSGSINSSFSDDTLSSRSASRGGAPSQASGDQTDSWYAESSDYGHSVNSGLSTSYGSSAAAASTGSLGHRTYSLGFVDPPADMMEAMSMSSSSSSFQIPPAPEPAPSARRRPLLAPPSANGGPSLLLPTSSTSSPSGVSPLAVSPISPISPSETAMPQREGVTPPPPPPPPLPLPSMVSQELQARWHIEQSRLASRGTVRAVRRYDSDNESLSEEEDIGEIALVRERGRPYYLYQSADAASLYSRSDETSTSRGRPLSRLSEASGTTSSLPRTPECHDGPHRPPMLAPDCSACGVRLDYMRYVCTTCGEGDMWTVNAVKAPFVPRIASEHESDSEGTAWGMARDSASSGSDVQTVHNGLMGRADSDAASNGSAASPDSLQVLDIAGPDGFEAAPRGYELCANCIEAHGITHSKAAARAARQRRVGHIRHAFREKIWSLEGWVDVDYSEDAECTICHGAMFRSRYKCVSCPKFDLCRACYQKVQEIHPAHVFLSLPDKPVAALPLPSRPDGVAESVPVRHPGAFCHNCLQDIVGPRFHCAVCPSWDLCIQCEGVGATGDRSHTPDHIMMKIPVPLASNEVEVVSRRARDRWYHQDLSAVAEAPSSHSSSPTIDAETVYAPALRSSVRGGPSPAANSRQGRSTPRNLQVVNIRDGLDHNARCANCNEWIMGRRFQCANCPSDPVPYNLCSICELRSYRVHDAKHVFFKFDRPVHMPLQSSRPLLPLLYRTRVGAVPATAVLNPRDPTSYLKHVLHKETLCDIHADQIRGIWLRCAHCAAGFDICSEAEPMASASHDPTHVFVVFKARVDMARFRELANLGGEHQRPLLQRQVYVS
ncbi:hypothetical protein CC85DRAFT_268587 [Cutaneotrichosporon oleaginosum]|uniref:ZZ-type domain-containing protein n=1 Tax=Cutaneotrichosporon oleaginosum TaxID=879819 RepID=A0A0J1BD50_9TREE|nr:uncharacterized protein CC85DRAFT_268587 [Cutaneotrichosporon oleaginosum]KLT45979.1 hypothetical protein CC85DRAFT_268587 [Cutaneotrichosporon oleaginosum]